VYHTASPSVKKAALLPPKRVRNVRTQGTATTATVLVKMSPETQLVLEDPAEELDVLGAMAETTCVCHGRLPGRGRQRGTETGVGSRHAAPRERGL